MAATGDNKPTSERMDVLTTRELRHHEWAVSFIAQLREVDGAMLSQADVLEQTVSISDLQRVEKVNKHRAFFNRTTIIAKRIGLDGLVDDFAEQNPLFLSSLMSIREEVDGAKLLATKSEDDESLLRDVWFNAVLLRLFGEYLTREQGIDKRISIAKSKGKSRLVNLHDPIDCLELAAGKYILRSD